jgi:acetyl-CoA acetyltransferase
LRCFPRIAFAAAKFIRVYYRIVPPGCSAKPGHRSPLVYGVENMKEVVIVSAVRTPVGKFQGSLQSFAAPRLGALAVREAVRRAGLEAAQIDECIMGCVLQAGLGQNPARQAAIYGGLSPEVGAFTVNQVCGSGLKATALAAQAVQTGNAEIVVAGGMESMSNAPYLLPQARAGYRMGNGTLVDAMIHDGLWEAYTRRAGCVCGGVASEGGPGYGAGNLPRRDCCRRDSGGQKG